MLLQAALMDYWENMKLITFIGGIFKTSRKKKQLGFPILNGKYYLTYVFSSLDATWVNKRLID